MPVLCELFELTHSLQDSGTEGDWSSKGKKAGKIRY